MRRGGLEDEPTSVSRIILRSAALAVAALFAYLLFWPSPIEPHAWTPGEDPGTSGPYVPNRELAAATPLPLAFAGPEDAAFDAEGFLYTGVRGGEILRVDPRSGAAVEWADTGGRPLGVGFRGDDLYVADALRGLLRIHVEGGSRVVSPVATHVDPPVTYADGLHVASDGVVWFTAPATRWPLSQARYEAMEGRPTGRLLRHDPETGRTSVELEGLHFANGVSMGPNEDFVLVAEWSAYRLTRLWLAGPKRGRREVFYENLPGFPDNLSLDPRGFFWVGLVVERSQALDRLHTHPPLMRLLPKLPESLQPRPNGYGWLVGIDLDGRVVHNLYDGSGRYTRVTGARRSGDRLYLTSDVNTRLLALPLPAGPELARADEGAS